MRTKYNYGWLGLRVTKLNGFGRLLRKNGWFKVDRANKNNPCGFDWMRYGRKQSEINGAEIAHLSTCGLTGLVGWISDAQYERGVGMTRKQWSETKIL